MDTTIPIIESERHSTVEVSPRELHSTVEASPRELHSTVEVSPQNDRTPRIKIEIPQPKNPKKRTTSTALSAKATTTKKMKAILNNVASQESRAVSTPRCIDVDEIFQAFQDHKYTGSDEKVKFFLQFIAARVHVCPLDNVRRLRAWGMPKKSLFALALRQFAQTSEDQDIKNVKAWGNTIGRLFKIFAQILWPNKHQLVKARHRCMYGIRIRPEYIPNTTELIPAFPNDFESPTYDQESNRRWSTGSTSSGYSDTTAPMIAQPQHTTGNGTHRTGQIKPFYDILENAHCYVVRIVIPLMDSADAKRIQVHSNLAQKVLTVSGSYIPGCMIGEPMEQLFSIRSPLLPVIYAPANANGCFHLDIALPSDIKDDEESIKFNHALWGIGIQYPRRKTIGQVTINFSSCFGNCHLGTSRPTEKESESDGPSTERDDQTPAPEDNSVIVDSPDQPEAPPQESQTSTPTTPTTQDRKLSTLSLVGRVVSVHGSLWGARYKGKTYHGKVTRITRPTRGKLKGYYVYWVKFSDCVEKFSLSDLQGFGAITDEEYDTLKAQEGQF